jgi:hypothetical protein
MTVTKIPAAVYEETLTDFIIAVIVLICLLPFLVILYPLDCFMQRRWNK